MSFTVKKYSLLFWLLFLVLSPVSGQIGSVIQIVRDSLGIQSGEEVNTGYGFIDKSDYISSIILLDSIQFKKGFIISPEELLIGKVPGLSVSSNNGMPGRDFTLINRGIISLNESNAPLIIVDGIILNNELSIINPNNIESFIFLRDASAAAIYGSRAANGAIIITTKKAQVADRFSVSYKTNLALSIPLSFVEVYTGNELKQIIQDHTDLFDPNSLDYLGSANTDWQKEIFTKSFSHSHTFTISGSNKQIPYRISIGYLDQNGILKNTGLDKYTGSINLNPAFLKDDLKVNIYIKGLNTNHNFGDVNAIRSSIFMDPTQSIMDGNQDSNGYFQWETYGAILGTPNPVEQALEIDNKSVNQRLLANIQLDYKLPVFNDETNEFRMNLNLGADYSNIDGHNNRPVSSPRTLTRQLNGILTDYSSKKKNEQLDISLNYIKDFVKSNSKIDALAGYSLQRFTDEEKNYTRGIVDDLHPYQLADSSYYSTKMYMSGLFVRMNYGFMNKYLLSFIARSEDYSRFIDRNNTISFLFAWQINEETFIKNVNAISDLKLNLGIGPFVVANNSKTNNYLNDSWEHIRNINLGLDFGFIKDRITGTFEIYKIKSENLLVNMVVPSGSNFSNTILINSAEIENRGYDFSLNLKPVSQKEIDLTLRLNISYNKNKVTRILPDPDPSYLGILYGDTFSGQTQITRVGYPAFSFFVNKQVYDEYGDPIEGMYVDLSGEGGIINGDNEDKYIFGNPVPNYLMGLSFLFNYKNIDVSVSSRFNLGNYVYNRLSASSSYDQIYQMGFWRNQLTSLNNTNFISRQFSSDYFVENASFFKLDNLSIGYNFKNLQNKTNIYTYISIQNALTITNYSGQDPEVVDGADYYYPRPRIFSLGINASF